MTENKRFSKFSRRDLLQTLSGALSNPNSRLNNKVVEATVEGVSEVVVLATLLVLAWSGSRDKLVSYSIDSEKQLENLQGFQDKMAKTLELRNTVDGLSKKLSALYYEWETAYYELGSDDESPRWNEPYAFTQHGLDHNFISEMQTLCAGISQKLTRLETSTNQYFDLSAGDNGIYYPNETVNQKKQNLSAFTAYGLVALMFNFYEEGLDSGLEALHDIKPDMPGSVMDSQNYVGRRGFMKLLAGLLGFTMVRKVQTKFALENNDFLNNLKARTSHIVNQMPATDDANFTRFFGCSLKKLQDNLSKLNQVFSQINIQDSSLSFNPALVSSLKSVQVEGKKSEKLFNDYFNAGTAIPPELTEITKYAWASQQLLSYSQSKQNELHQRHWLNALVLGLGFTSIAAFCETVLFPMVPQRSRS